MGIGDIRVTDTTNALACGPSYDNTQLSPQALFAPVSQGDRGSPRQSNESRRGTTSDCTGTWPLSVTLTKATRRSSNLFRGVGAPVCSYLSLMLHRRSSKNSLVMGAKNSLNDLQSMSGGICSPSDSSNCLYSMGLSRSVKCGTLPMHFDLLCCAGAHPRARRIA